MSGYDRVKDWRYNNKRKLVQAFGGTCGACGLIDEPVVFDFHHLVSSEKDFTLTNKIVSWSKLVVEAKKCVMLCAHCHRKHHAGVLQLPAVMNRFDENKIEKSVLFDDCPVCGNSKPKSQITCSKECARIHRTKIDWDAIDLVSLYGEKKSYLAVARFLGVSDVTVKKRLVKLLAA